MEKVEENVVLNNVQQLLKNQTEKGLKKYGHTVNPDNLDFDSWVNHACEELIDLLVYLQCLKEKHKNMIEKNKV